MQMLSPDMFSKTALVILVSSHLPGDTYEKIRLKNRFNVNNKLETECDKISF